MKILILLGDLNRCNGITSYVMNYYQKLDKNKFSIDFVITNDDIDEAYEKNIIENNSKIFYVPAPKIKSMFSDLKNIKKFLKQHLKNYDIFYCHLLNQGYFYLHNAKKLGFEKRVFHSHNIVTREKNKLRDFRNQLFKHLVAKEANYYLACSDVAGKDLLGEKGNYQLVNNAISIEQYIFDEDIRNQVRKTLQLEDKVVFIQVGRLAYQKNPQFTIEVFREIKKNIKNAVLLFVGSGADELELKQMVNQYQLESDVLFLGTRNDVPNLLMGADVFLFPSRFEGLGMVAIEAQVSGLPCYISATVPRETKILDTTQYLETESPVVWAKEIEATYLKAVRGNYAVEVKNKGYDIHQEAQNLELILEKISLE